MVSMSDADVRAYESRRMVIKRCDEILGEPCEVESVLHGEIIEECKRRGWIALKGAMHRETFRPIGEWDFTIVGDQGRKWFVEAKTGKGKLSPEQQAMIAWAAKLGHTVHVVRSLEDFLKVVEQLKD